MEYLTKSTTPLIQPMDQGVIHAFKNHYRWLRLNQVLAVGLVGEGEVVTREERTLANLKDYGTPS